MEVRFDFEVRSKYREEFSVVCMIEDRWRRFDPTLPWMLFREGVGVGSISDAKGKMLYRHIVEQALLYANKLCKSEGEELHSIEEIFSDGSRGKSYKPDDKWLHEP